MKAFIGALVLVGLVGQLIAAAEFSPEELEVCLKQAERKAEAVYILPKMEEIFAAKSAGKLDDTNLYVFFDECKGLVEKAHFATIENDCSYDLEKLIEAGKVKPMEKLGHVLEMRDYCLEVKKSNGILGKYSMGDSSWFTDMINLAASSRLQ